MLQNLRLRFIELKKVEVAMNNKPEEMEQAAENVEIPNEEEVSKKRGILFKIFYVLFFPFKLVLKLFFKRLLAILVNLITFPLGTIFAFCELYFYAWVLQMHIYPYFGIYPH